jgi:hypothetical protein
MIFLYLTYWYVASSGAMGHFSSPYLKLYAPLWCGYEVAMIIFHLFFHAMMAIIQLLSFCVIAFVASNIFKSGG